MSETSPPGGAPCWCVVPAAGIGRRMGGEIPKQYLRLRGRAILAHTLERLGAHPRVRGIVVPLAESDRWFDGLDLDLRCDLTRVPGGAERCHSVLSGLDALRGRAAPQDWVLVHDAVRPCLRAADLDLLLAAIDPDPTGGLLGLPVRDTMKRVDAAGLVRATVDREGLWHALTPQAFRFAVLERALRAAVSGGRVVTDEAQAVELAGLGPRMVEGHADNIKVTRPADMALAELYLAHQEAHP